MGIQLQSMATSTLEQGLLFSFLALGVLITFRFFRFPDLTAEGSYPLGGAVAAALLVHGVNAVLATLAAMLAGLRNSAASGDADIYMRETLLPLLLAREDAATMS